jgi:hypothetical protein
MISILDKLFKKRFCLPADADIREYENGNNTINGCFCGNYNHVACVFQGKDRYIEQG